MAEVDQACLLMKQALEILDAQEVYHSAAILDSAIRSLPGAGETDGVLDSLSACDPDDLSNLS